MTGMEQHAGVHAPSPAMVTRVAVGLVAVAAFESLAVVANMPWVWVPVLAVAVLAVWGGEWLCRRHLSGGSLDGVWRPGDVLVAAGAVVLLFGIGALVGGAASAEWASAGWWLGPPGIVSAVLVSRALPGPLASSWGSLGLPRRLVTGAMLALPAAVAVTAAALGGTQRADTAALAAGILFMTLVAAIVPEGMQSSQQPRYDASQ